VAAVQAIAPRTRWYSSEAAKENGAEAKKAEGEAEAESPEAVLKKQLEAKDAEAKDFKVASPVVIIHHAHTNAPPSQDRYLRSVADFRNLQDRTAREMKAARDFAIQKFAKDLVESVDNFDRALSMVPEEKLKSQVESEHLKDLVSLHEGLKMTETILLQTLKKHGLERFDPDGEVFNPNEHEATFMTPMQDKEHNTVFHTQEKGFKLNGRILRPAKVGVVKNR
jgi:molecular chaperone GrpE